MGSLGNPVQASSVGVMCVCCSFKDEKHLVFGFEEFPQFLVDYLDCCIEQDNDDERE